MIPDSADSPSTPAPVEAPEENPHYVLRRGEILGPFDLEQLKELIGESMLEYDDFVQQAGTSEWLPLRWLLIPNKTQDLEGALAPTWRTLIKWAWLRLRYNLDEESLSAGWVCLGLTIAGLFLSRWPMLLWAPWAVLAFLGGGVLYRRNRPGSGIALMLATALILVAFRAYFWSGMDPVRRHEPPPTPAIPSAVSVNVPAPIPPPAAIVVHSSPAAPEAKTEAVISTPLEAPAMAAVAPVSSTGLEPISLPPAPGQGAEQVVSDFAKKIGTTVSSVFAPTGPSDPAAAAAATAAAASAFVSEHSACLVFVEDKGTGSAGSGFICSFRGKPALFTNIHVVAGMRAPQFTRLDKSTVNTASLPASAIGHDILHYTLPVDSAPPKLLAAERVEDVAAIGDEVFVLGNSEGARVITPLAGKIAGIGPELIEVTAEFVPGNSGSPIIHAKSGTVIGIATYIRVRDKKWLSEENAEAKIRRFGYRLDSVKGWQPVDWASFAEERVVIEKIKNLTSDLALLLRDLKDGVIVSAAHTNPAISPHVRSFVDKVGGTARVNPIDRRDAASTLFKFMRSVSQQDIRVAATRIRYDYFQRALSEEKLIRTQFTEVFDEIVKGFK